MVAGITEAVTDTKTVFQNICSFFSRSNLFTIFQECLSVCRTDMFFQEMLYVLRTDTNFPGRFIEQNVFFQDGLCLFVKQTLLSHKTDNFPKNPYLVLKPIHISTFSRRLLLILCTVLYLKQIGIFQEGTLFLYRYFVNRPAQVNRSQWLLSIYYIIYTYIIVL